MNKPEIITVLGGGNGAFATAAHLKLLGANVRLFEAPEQAGNLKEIQRRNGIDLFADNVLGVSSGFAALDLITDDPETALKSAGIVLYVVPSFCEARFTELCASYFRPEQMIVLFCGGLGAALELARALHAMGLEKLPTILEMEGLVYGAVKKDPGSVRVLAMKKGLRCAALTADESDSACRRLAHYYPDFRLAADVLETGLRNLNPIVHAPISILNAGRTSPGNRWRYYWEGITDAVARVLEDVDHERLAVATGLDLSLSPASETLTAWYGNGHPISSQLGHVLRSMRAYQEVWAPESLEHRFITEDVPFGLVPIESLAKVCAVPTPSISSLVTLASCLLGADFRAAGRHLEWLSLQNIDRVWKA